jgi:hypothetical protein
MARDGDGGRVEEGDRSREIEWKRDVQMPGCVLEKLEEELGVQKRMWPCPSRSWRAGGARGGTAKLGSGSAS